MSVLIGFLTAVAFVVVMLFLATAFGLGLGLVEFIILFMLAFGVGGAATLVVNMLRNGSAAQR